MKRLSLRPYPGEILLYDDFEAFRRKHKQVLGEDYSADKRSIWGRCVPVINSGATWFLLYVHKGRVPTLAHELAHVLLMVFDTIGTHPSEGNGEPFCYMLSTLVEEARA